MRRQPLVAKPALAALFVFVACSSRASEPPIEALAEPPISAPTPEPAPVEPEVAATPEPAPEPPPDPFPGRSEVRVGELLEVLAAQVEVIAESPEVRRDYEQFLIDWELADDPELYLDYVRIKLAFEATRAGGLWGVSWQITNELPQSDLVWAQWRELELPDDDAELPEVTAIAECDELSALFAYVAQRIGLSKRSEVGLFWPTGNHTVAVWTLDRKSDDATRIVVPTSQIFLAADESLGTGEFDPWKQKTIFDYRRTDARLDLELPAELARRFVRAVQAHGGRSQAELQGMRNVREERQWATE
ncbi:hypothetical protein ACNOYE_08390 [Nannocystaceae bacterium ST9]